MPKQQNAQQEKPSSPETIEQKLDRIAESLRRLDRRDKIRTMWMSIRSMINMIPLLIVLGGAVYLYWERENLLQEFTKSFTQQLRLQGLPTGPILKQLEQFLR